MSRRELEELAAESSVQEFPAGAMVMDYAVQVPDDIWMVCTGHVSLQASADGSAIDTVESGGIFGYVPLLTGSGADFSARTTEPSTLIRLPGAQVRAQFAKPAGLAFLASSAWNTVSGNRTPMAPVSDSRPVGELVHGAVVFAIPDTSVRDAVVQMTEHRVSYVLISLPRGELGIFTDRDLRSRVVAAGLPVTVPVAQVMSAPARTVTADLTAETVLMDMLECGLRHMPVLTQRGEVIGVLEDADLLAASARQSFVLRRSIGAAKDATELQRVAREITGTAVDLFRNGTKATATSAILSVVIDTVVRRALEIALAETDNAPTEGFAWLTLGSVARREAMPSSDVDSALSWIDELSSAGGRLRELAKRVHAILDASGLPADSNGAVASKPKFARSQSEWAKAAEGWLGDPLHDRGLIMSSLLIDGRVVWGDAAWQTVPTAYRRIRSEHPNTLRLQLLDALSGRVRTRSLRDVLSRRGGTFDLKNHALTPIVNLARWGGLTAGVASASTPVRLAAAAGTGALSDRDATILGEVFTMLQRLRMAHQVEQLSGGHSPGDIILMSELSALNRSLLNDALREIVAVQRRVGDLGMPTA
ncbi:putative nucleotidyltransferase substrate binding domain-containing protein [Antrihabitans sp. YC2-6]|uniref:putative nucleotidyltransferase substrate binding domain-containing protein n=1 Tax=Antrihabitans sp. YC2-6 TaxID=2799498 RepID=UPI0018F33EB1|nr:putative nucleotidyltransferase substrate binding domain-containing protein [Antrihabitans sp. YC2-6]MBJ8346697.1 CBS domain-containing protein [Antrihabitans sp. YC2-6]